MGALKVLAAALLASPAWAAAGPRVMTWDDCVAAALTNNPDLASSGRTLDAGRASHSGSYNGLFPQLNLSNSYSDGSGFNNADPALRWTGQASLSLNLFNAGVLAGIRSAAAGVSQAEAGLLQTSANLRLSLRNAFSQLLTAQTNADVSRRIRDLRRKDADLVTLRYDSGTESKGNMLRAKAQYAQSEADLAQSLRTLRTSQKALDRQMGVDDFSPVVAAGTLAAQRPPELPESMESLLASRPDMALQRAAVKSALASLSQARASLWPSLAATYSRSRTGTDEFPSTRRNWSFGATLSLPLFSGGPTALYYASEAAKKLLERADFDLRSVRNAAVSDLENAWAAYSGAFEQIVPQTALLEAARQRNDEADIRYASGLMSYDNWEIIASDRIGQERQMVQALLSAALTEAAWNKALGKGLGE